jgi:hypothetical protein
VYGDFSRLIDEPLGAYTGVLAEQGAVLLDAELNEHAAIVVSLLRRLATDVVGPFGGPLARCGFGVTPLLPAGSETYTGITLGPGHYYVHGRRLRAPASGDASAVVAPPLLPPRFLVCLQVWEQAVGVVREPGLLDPAIAFSAPDTTRRSQVRWSPALRATLPGSDAALTGTETRAEILEAFASYEANPPPRPRMAARALYTRDPEEPLPSSPAAPRYRGNENQLYRVEIHEPGTSGVATFKWSRENGSVELVLTQLPATPTLAATYQYTNPWRDPSARAQGTDWVELVDDSWLPFGSPDALLQVQDLVSTTPPPSLNYDASRHPFVRRWDQPSVGSTPQQGIPVGQATSWYELERGVEIRFEAGTAAYQRGDYWLVPARTSTRDVDWPTGGGVPRSLPPHGPARYLAPLALVPDLMGTEPIVELRSAFAAAAKPRLREP